MKCPALFTRSAYRGVRSAAALASPCLPQRLHPGIRAFPGFAHVGGTISAAQFARAVLESRWRSLLLHRHVLQLQGHTLAEFLEHRIEYAGAACASQILAAPRPILFATPHYGAPTVACMAGARLMHGRRALNVFFDKPRHGAQLSPLFERAGIPSKRMLGGTAGIRAALRALERGECVAILPDVFDDLAQTVVVPFFGRLLRVAAGTAFLALRTDALIVPVFAEPRRDFGLRVTFDSPIDPRRLIDGAAHRCQTADDGPARIVPLDERQAVFTLTRALFARIEEHLRRAPEHWHGWEKLPHVSTSLGAPADMNDATLLRALKAKFHALPEPVQDIPELEFLLQ